MADKAELEFRHVLPVRAMQAGYLVSRGVGRHEKRMMGEYELIFVREGVLEIAEESRSFSVAAGQALLLAPGRWHYGTADYAPDLSFFWIHFALAPTFDSSGNEPDLPLMQLFKLTTVGRPDYLAELFRRYIDDQEGNRLDPTAAALLLLLMLNEAQASKTARAGAGPITLAARAESYIRTNFHLPLTASVIADYVGCNPHYLSRIYRQSYGSTLTEAVHRTRVEYGCRLLLNSGLRIHEVARSCGMTDVGYFVQLFKRHKGLTPAAYRRLHAQVYVNTE